MIFLILLPVFLQNVFSAEICDTLGANYYEEMGCKAIYENKIICPSRYECENYSLNDGFCRYNNKFYKNGESVKVSNRYMDCKCSLKDNKSNFDCPWKDCPPYIPSNDNCFQIFSLNETCSIGEKCDNDFVTCLVDNSTYKEGEVFYPNNTCYECLCHPGYTGSVSDPHCRRLEYTLEISYQNEFSEKCGPVYYREKKNEVMCSPHTFVCNNSNTTFSYIEKSENLNGVQCEFGSEKFYKGDIFNVTNIDYWGMENVYRCKCLLPPLITCFYYLLY